MRTITATIEKASDGGYVVAAWHGRYERAYR